MKKITLDEFCNLKFVSNLEFSPNGKHLCFVVSQADREGNKYSSCIYTLKGKTVRQLTSGGMEGSFQFLDEDTILFPGNRDESKAPSVVLPHESKRRRSGEGVHPAHPRGEAAASARRRFYRGGKHLPGF